MKYANQGISDLTGWLVDMVFRSLYAETYDLLYHDKDYVSECDLIERLFQDFADCPVQSVLDLGCGTGNHAIPLARRGYEVVGLDYSASMLAQARRKTAEFCNDCTVVFYQGDLRKVDLCRRFDASLMMFAVLGYQLEDDDVLAALKTARRHLSEGGLLIFDVWYGPAVIYQQPSRRLKEIPTRTGKVMRFASANLDDQRNVCQVYFRVLRLENDQVVAETEEHHSVRYFFPESLEHFLGAADFKLVRLGGFPDFEQDANETTWNVLTVARAIRT